jgi:hypothetical protein
MTKTVASECHGGERRHSLREGKHVPRNGYASHAKAIRFEHSCFEFWICFGFRVSYLEFRKMSIVVTYSTGLP